MDNIVSIKRKAQKLVQQGAYDGAIEHYERIVESGEMDPYDYVVLGDLLLRSGQTENAIERYGSALDSYASGGLNRNAIALAKRIKRLVPDRTAFIRRLGDLYAAEGLNTEAALHYLEFLERAREEDEFPDAAEDICCRLLGFSLPSFELVGRIAEIAESVERGLAVAPGVLYQSQQAERTGHEDMAETLATLAHRLDPNVEIQDSPSAPAESWGDLPADSGASASPGAASTAARHDSGALSLEGEGDSSDEPTISFDFDDPSAVDLDAAPAPSPAKDAGPDQPEPGVVSLDDFAGGDDSLTLDTGELESDDDQPLPLEPRKVGKDSGIISLDEDSEHEVPVYDIGSEIEENASIRNVETEEDEASGAKEASSDSIEDAEELRARGDHCLEKGETLLAIRTYMRAANAFRHHEATRKAEEVFHHVVQLDPNHLEALRGLVDMAHGHDEQDRMARYGCELGDVYLAREMYAEAKVEFERVLEFDPSNAKAQSRVNRLNSLDDPGPSEADIHLSSDERDGAKVEVRDDEGNPTQTSLDLAAILEEFREAVVDRIPSEDAQSHYDMGMAYREMSLVEEAVQEFEVAAENEEIRPRSLEMLAECYLLQEKGEDALRALEEVLAHAEDPGTQARIHLAMGRARESLGRTEEAEESYFQALELNDDLVEAAERLNAMEKKRAEGA